MAKITRGIAERLVKAIEEIQACDDGDYRLTEALSVTREAIRPWYDYAAPEDGPRSAA
jgi:hypothetical protein